MYIEVSYDLLRTDTPQKGLSDKSDVESVPLVSASIDAPLPSINASQVSQQAYTETDKYWGKIRRRRKMKKKQEIKNK